MRMELIKEKYVHKYLHYIHNDSETIFISHRGMIPYIERNHYGKYAVVPLGIDHTQFSPGDATLFLNEKKPKLLFVGRIAVEKNIEAFLEISDEKYAKFVVGDGPERETLEKKYPKTTFLGIKRGEDLTAVYRSIDVFVFPSKTDTLGLVNLEAMACGKPIVAYDIENMRGFVEPMHNGILVSEEHSLESGIDAALSIPREHCIETAAQFCWHHHVRAFLEHQVPISRKVWI